MSRPGSPRVVVIGSGVVGAAVADELTGRGWTDVTVLDRGALSLPGGSSSHAPGLVFQASPSRTLARFAKYTVEKMSSLDLDGQWCFNQVGGLEVATEPARVDELWRRHGFLSSVGVESTVVGPDECAALHPLVPADRVLAGLHIPTDGLAKAPRAVEAQARRAISRGARFLGEQRVVEVLRDKGRVTGVRTETVGGRGDTFPADVVVQCTGFWGPLTGALVDLPTPLLPMAHQYARTAPVPGLRDLGTQEAAAPILRHQDRDLYFREHGERLGIGSYAHRPIAVDPANLPTHTEMPSSFDFTAEDWAPAYADAQALLPALQGVGIEHGFNGVFSFTADGMPLLGEHPDLRGYWVAEAVWVTHSCGVARALAEWLVDGHPSLDVHACDLNRFTEAQRSPGYVAQRAARNFVEVYDILHPLDPPAGPRPMRTSPFHLRQQELGAVFTEIGGWERPLWFESNAGLPEVARIPGRGEWAARHWSPVAGAEALATRDRVGLFDMTPLTRVEVSGPGACAFLDGLTSNKVDVAVGRVVYTLMLTESGGVLSDLTVTRLGEELFQVGANGEVDVDRLRRLAPAGVSVRDVTAGTCGVGLWGPRALDVLSAVSTDDLSFGYFRARRIHVGAVPVLALRVSYVGELGWELYTTADQGLALWDALWAAGSEHGMVAAGRHAFTSLRLEKGYRASGVDMTSEDLPAEAGLAFAVKPGDYPGAAAVSADPRRRLVPVLLDDPTDVVMGAEPVYSGDTAVGYVTSAAYGPTIDAGIAYAWLPADLAAPGTPVAVEYFGARLPGVVAAEPLFDPEGKRLRP
ncbi:FAD-dependent oxidoreductase [Pseudonocardia yuanmonensis]|uniref:FAD-dependent oxidoreductase n=1 Tax=Pseudonocardia yuanmonensis TaxID=1095914 RepID=A0ABP8W299_9PSEU